MANQEKAKTPVIDIGINSNDREKIVDGLSALPANNYTLYFYDAQLPLERQRSAV